MDLLNLVDPLVFADTGGGKCSILKIFEYHLQVAVFPPLPTQLTILSKAERLSLCRKPIFHIPTTSKNKVKRCRPSKTMTLLKDTHWLLIYIYIVKKGWPSPEPNRIRKSILKIWIKICGFHAQVFYWFSRVVHCLFTGFHGRFTHFSRSGFGVGFVWNSGVRYIFILVLIGSDDAQ